MNKEVKYPASLDMTAIVVTAIITLSFVCIIFAQFPSVSEGFTQGPLSVIILCSGIYIFSLCFRPLRYSVTPTEVRIVRLIADVVVPRSEIVTAEQIEPRTIRWSIRTFGVGGLFGYFGKFSNSKIGNMTWYVTRRDTPVLIKTKGGRKILVSPNDPGRFMSDLGF